MKYNDAYYKIKFFQQQSTGKCLLRCIQQNGYNKLLNSFIQCREIISYEKYEQSGRCYHSIYYFTSQGDLETLKLFNESSNAHNGVIKSSVSTNDFMCYRTDAPDEFSIIALNNGSISEHELYVHIMDQDYHYGLTKF